jgi:flavin-dependent dehydrogenase
MTVTQRAPSNRYLDRPSPSSLADVIDTILDKGFVIDVNVRVHQQRTSVGAVGVLSEFKRVKESGMRVKKRVKRGVKKGVKRVKSAPPEAYLAGAGVLVGGAALLLLATTKRGQELLIRTAQLALRPEADKQESRVQEDVGNESAEDLEAEPEKDTNGDDESRVTDLKPRDQRPRSAASGRRPRSPMKASAPAES